MAVRSRNHVYAEASFVGFMRAIAGLPLEHPFDSIKSKMQTQLSSKLSFIEMAKQVYRTQGIKNGFYAGFVPSATRNIVKQLYRWPLMLILPQFYNKTIPTSLKDRYSSIHKVSTGLTMALIDTFIVCPFERLKVYLQTKKNDLTLRAFFAENRHEIPQSLFRGLNPFLWRQMISWTSFLYTDHKFRQTAREWKGLGPHEALDNQTLLYVSSLVGIANIILVMPFDFTKTLYQQHSNEFAKMKLKDTVKAVQQRGGLSSFYRGWQPRMVQYMIQSLFTVTALEKMEQKIRENGL